MCVIDRRRGDAFCQCKDGLIRDKVSGQCKHRSGHPDNIKFCQSDDDCPPHADCKMAFIPHQSKCICRRGFIFNSDNTRCLLKVEDKNNKFTTLYLKRRCTDDYQCPRHASCRVSRQRCICQEGSQPDPSHILCLIKSKPDEGKHDATSSATTKSRLSASEPKIHKTRAPITTASTSSFASTTKVATPKDTTTATTNEASTPTEKHLTKPLPTQDVMTTAKSSTTHQSISTFMTKTVTTDKTKSLISTTVKPTKAVVGTDRSLLTKATSQLPTATHLKGKIFST